MLQNIFVFMLFLLQCSTIMPMMDMAIMMGAQQGASIANQAVNTMFQDMGTALQEDQSNLQNSLQSFSAQVSQAESKNARILGKIFTNSLSYVSKKEGNQSDYAQQMQTYIEQAISIHKPPFYYILASATTFDQAFANGTMYTPQGPLWKNIYQYGDWEYDQTTDSFYQFVKVPLIPSSSPAQETNSFNNIFTEYVTFARSYEIRCEITLYQTQYPFFVGIQFNKTRWLSGNADSLKVSRLLGIYGSSKTAIGTYYTEQPPTSDATTNPTLQLSPLEQIAQNKATQQASISSTLFTDLNNAPVTFVVRIITSPQKIHFKIWPKNSTEPTSFTTVKSVAPNLYLYHNIGFISSGAIAQFHLIKPQDLLFSDSAKEEFAQELKTLLTT